MNYKSLIAALALLLLAWPSAGGSSASGREQAAGGEFLHSVWTTENGLPQNDVKLVQTRDGYLWLGTNGGLARFDGVNFTVFDTATVPELKSNRILALLEDRAGNLWAGTEGGGLTRYAQSSFTTFTDQSGLPDNHVFDLAEDARGDLWACTLKGLVRLSAGRFITYTTRDGLPHSVTGYIRAGADGSVWFLAGDRLVQFRDGSFVTHQVTPDFPDDWARQVRDLFVAADGEVWVATSYGLARFGAGRFTVVNRPARRSGRPASDHVLLFLKDRAGRLAFLTPGGLARLRDGELVVERKLPDLSRRIDSFWRARQAIIDREDNLWIGTGGLGLYRYRERQLTAYAAEEGLVDDGFYPITEDAGGGLWFGGYNPQHSLYHFAAGKFKRYQLPSGVSSLYQDGEGGLWIGSYTTFSTDSVYRFKDGRLTAEADLNRVIGGSPVTAIHQDRAGDFWFGTISAANRGGGLHRVRGGVVTSYRGADGLISNEVRCIVEDRSGALWIGTMGGLSRLQDGRFTNYSTQNGLSHNYVRDIYEDSDGALWIGTYGGGLNRLKDGRISRFTTRDGLFDNVVSRILEDDRGNFWLSCNRGIYRVSRQELNDYAEGRTRALNCVSYGVADGMKTNEANGGVQPAGWKSRDGRLWFPTIKGVVVVDPHKINSLPPPVLVEQVLIGETPAAPRSQVEVRPGQGDLTIHYTGLSFVAPEKVRFKCKLEGYDADWVNVGARRIAYYTSLPPGRYTFRVMASNNDGVWSTQEASIRITVIPPFWRTWWFTALSLVLVAGLAALAFRYRIGQLKRKQARQEAYTKELLTSQEQERQRIAAELHDSLGQNLLIIKNTALIGLNVSAHDASSSEQFAEISTMTSQAIEEVRQITYNLRPYHLDQLGLKEAIEFMLEKAAGVSPVRFSSDLDETAGLFSKEEEMGLYRIVQEGVNNIIKHSGAARAKVALKRDRETVRLTVEDDGTGFAAKTDQHGEANGRGFGLTGIKERARMLGARATVNSVPGQGTTITVTLTLKGGRHEK